MNTKNLVYSAVMAALICVSAWIKIPIPGTPVPITMQTGLITFAALFLPRKNALASVCVYLLLGLAGIPVFSSGLAGFGAIFGATGGFIMGFPVMVYTVSFLFELMKRYSKHSPAVYICAVFPVVIGHLVLYICGAFWFSFIMQTDILYSVSVCIIPFLAGDMLKGAAAVILYAAISRLTVRVF